ncbi:unnamed protein product [Scytosiphon promiscuus]
MQESVPAATGTVVPPLPPVSTPTRRASMGSSTSPGSPELEVSVLRRELLMEKHRNSHLEGELVKLRKSAVEISQQVEAEEECLINRVKRYVLLDLAPSPLPVFFPSLCVQMMKRLMELKKEKEDLALEVEREEELLTNTLQKKLNQASLHRRAKFLRQEKVDLENQLEREQEYVVNKLHKQLAQVTADKERMAMEVEREEEFLTNKLVKKLDQLKEEKASVEELLAHERKEVELLAGEKGELEARVEEGAKALLSKLQEALERAHKRPEQSGLSEAKELEAMRAQAQGLVDAATTSRQRSKDL